MLLIAIKKLVIPTITGTKKATRDQTLVLLCKMQTNILVKS